MSMSNVSQKTY